MAEVLLFILRRLGRLLLTVWLISTIIFFVIRVIPGDPALVIAGVDASAEDIAAIRAKIGTDRPLTVQYFDWLWQVVRFDFGTSLSTGQPVTAADLRALRPDPLPGPPGHPDLPGWWRCPWAWSRRCGAGPSWDYLGMGFSQLGMAVPSFWLGILLLLALAVKIPLFPLFGSGSFKHLVLPAVALGIARAAVLLRLTRASMVEELSKEYVITARAKGLTERMVKYKHALRNGLLPVVTIAGIQLGYMLGGAIIIEQVFSLPGLGRLFLTGVYQRDFPLIQGGVVFVAFAFSLINFLVDILYSVLNPRIRVG